MTVAQASTRVRKRRVVAAVAGLIVVAVLAAAGPNPDEPVAEALLADETFDPTVGPLGPITVVGDSVLLGAMLYAPTLSEHLVDRGWGPVRVRAGGGYSTGYFDVTLEARASYWIERWRGEGWDTTDVVVNLGANDSGFCDRDLACARAAILHLVDVIGPGHRIWWSKITRHPAMQHQQDNWNLALTQIDAERADFTTWDWPAVMAAGPFPSHDNTHLSPDGYRLRSELMADEITAELARGRREGPDAPLPTASGPAGEFVPLTSTRVLDTRSDPPGRLGPATTVTVDVSDVAPEGATAVAAYVSATATGGPGFLTAYRCDDERPATSNVNYLAGQTRGALALVELGADADFCIYTHVAADVLVDLQGAFVPDHPDGLGFVPLGQPARLIDTRVDGGPNEVTTVAVPDGAAAVAINVTAVADDDGPGYLTAYPCDDDRPTSATVNHLADDVLAGLAFVPSSADATVCIYSSALIDVVVDLQGTFTDSVDSLVYVPATVDRTLDTRSGIGGWLPVHGAGQTVDARVAPPGAAAVSGTITIAGPSRDGFLTAWGCDGEPGTSSVNAAAGGFLANAVTTGLSPEGRLCVYSHSLTGSTFDTAGWWVERDAS